LGEKVPIYGSADITNSCNLKCKHCYWWKNWKPSNELSPEQWRTVIREKLKGGNLFQIALTGGEPLLKPETIKVFNEELHKKISYIVSIDGTEKIHNLIRGPNVYKKVKQHVKDYNGMVFSNTTINSLNCNCIEDIVKEWNGLLTRMNFQFYTPFSLDDKLWLPYGKKRNKVIDKILKLKQEYQDLFLNTDVQLNLFRSNKWTKECPTPWSVISLNQLGKIKQPCCMGGENKPICERCGMCEAVGIYAGLYQGDLEWFKIHDSFNKR